MAILFKTTRRSFLKSVSGLALLPLVPQSLLRADDRVAPNVITKTIPVSGEKIPVIGMGSSRTFNVGDDVTDRARCVDILKEFFNRGGGMIDSSPMYGSSEEVIGHCLREIKDYPGLFSATKVWILGKSFGISQMQNSELLWGVPRFDLMQIHNMLSWETHLETLKQWKAEGRIRYIGITTSHGRRHSDLIKALQQEQFDFVQFSYNLVDREAEQYLLPLAAERGIAVIINRPFQRGDLFDLVEDKPLPDFAAECDCNNWAQYFLKYVVSHPDVTCAIPATSQVPHMQENMGANFGKLPTPDLRARMAGYFT